MNSKTLIQRHEGRRRKPYYDSEGILTIGYGYNLEKGISDGAIDYLFNESMQEVLSDALSFDWYSNLSPVRQAVIENMLFNLGRSRFMGFKKTIKYLASGDYKKASTEMLDSKWARQVGNRALELSEMMKTNEWPNER